MTSHTHAHAHAHAHAHTHTRTRTRTHTHTHSRAFFASFLAPTVHTKTGAYNDKLRYVAQRLKLGNYTYLEYKHPLTHIHTHIPIRP